MSLSIPLFIFQPSTKSFRDSVSDIIHADLFTLQILKLEPSALLQPAEAKACVCVFSLFEKQMALQTYQYLKALKELRKKKTGLDHDPSLRIILMACHRKIPLENWFKIGVNEFIVEPIFPKALCYKISRHYYRAISGLKTAEQFKKIADHVTEMTPVTPRKHEWHFYTDPQGATKIPATNYGVNIDQVHVRAKVPQILFDSGEWIAKHKPGVETDDTWIWIPKLEKQETARFEFIGHKPVFDVKQKIWHFTGEAPELVVYKPEIKSKDFGIVFKHIPAVKDPANNPQFKTKAEAEVVSVTKYVFVPNSQKRKAFISNVYVNEPKTTSIEDTLRFLENWKPDTTEHKHDPLKDFLHGKITPTDNANSDPYSNHIEPHKVWTSEEDQALPSSENTEKTPFRSSIGAEEKKPEYSQITSENQATKSSLSAKEAPPSDAITSKVLSGHSSTDQLSSLKGRFDTSASGKSSELSKTSGQPESERGLKQKTDITENKGQELPLDSKSEEKKPLKETTASSFFQKLKTFFYFGKTSKNDKNATTAFEKSNPTITTNDLRTGTQTLSPKLELKNDTVSLNDRPKNLVHRGATLKEKQKQMSSESSTAKQPFNLGDLSHKPSTHSWSLLNHESDPDVVGLLLKFKFKDSLKAFYKKLSKQNPSASKAGVQMGSEKTNHQSNTATTQNPASISSQQAIVELGTEPLVKESFFKRIIRRVRTWVRN